MTVEAVLFDIDGTLVDSNDLHVRAWLEAFEAHGFDITPEAMHGQIGKGGDLLVPTLLPDIDAQTAKVLDEAHGAIFKEMLPGVKPFPGARELLAHTRKSGRSVALASSASQGELDHYLDLLDARDLVDATTSGDDVKASKPAPDIFALALERLGVAAEHAVVVGDSPFDVKAARGCGAATVALRSGGFSDKTLRDAGAVALYDGVGALLADFDDSPLAR